jgi:drug/metabolite transporter (DMT)-like permease
MSKNKEENKDYDRNKFIVIISITIVFWAFAFPFIKFGLEELSPINLTIMRLLIACILFIFLLLMKPKDFSKLQKKDIIPIFFLGFLGIIVYHLGLNYGEQYVSASVASLIIAIIPIIVVIFAISFLKEKITFKIVAGITLSLIGVLIISTYGNPTYTLEIRYILGAIAVFIAALVGAGYTVAGKKMLSRYSPLSLTVYAFLLGSLGLIPFISISLFEEVAVLSIRGWIVLLFLGIFPTVIAYILWYVALEMKSASNLGTYLFFIPVLSTIISVILLNEEITWLFVIGGILVIIGLHIVNRREISKNKINN